MPCLGKTLSHANISCLDFKLDWDISGAASSVKVTNNSTVVDVSKLKWWFFITSPSGVSVYGVDINSGTTPAPDVNGVAWTTRTFSLPTPFGNPPCGQVEFSPSAPYTVTVFVQDITSIVAPIEGYSKNTIIVRPTGNSINTCGNFGTAQASMKVDCGAKVIMCFDSTKMIYNNIITPLSSTRKWTLVYPEDAAGDVPNLTSTATNVNFPVSVNSNGYMVYLNVIATYDYGNNITVKVQYKLYDKFGGLGLNFAVNCNTNLCLLQCQMEKFYQKSKEKCGEVVDAALSFQMIRLQWMYSRILTGIFQPLCGIDVPALIEQMKKDGKFDDNCDCGCGENDNFGFSNPNGANSPSGGCCPVTVNVIDQTTGQPPASCPNGYFPAQVLDPTGATVIGVALTMIDEINIINTNSAWMAYGTAFPEGNCKVGFYSNIIGTIPPVFIIPSDGGTGGGTIIVNIIDKGSGIPPALCPNDYFPVQVYDPTSTTIIGVAYNVAQLVGILNATPAWTAYGTAFVVDNCHVGWYPAPGVSDIPPVDVGTTITTGCVNGKQLYPVSLKDLCYPLVTSITSTSFPLNVYVDFGLGAGPQFVTNAASQAAMITALNAFSSKPASITFSAGPAPDQVLVNNTNCVAYSGTIALTVDAGSNSYLLYAPNHASIAAVPNITNAEFGMAVKSLSVLGKLVTGSSHGYWHSIKIGNYLLSTEPTTGKIYFWDITNPLMASLVRVIQLSTVVTGPNANFTGNPHSRTINSPLIGTATIYDLYFPTDPTSGAMSMSAIYVFETVTGTAWTIDFYAPAGSEIVAAFQDDRLIGKCPRVFVNGLIYFTQDGDLETATSQSSTVPVGQTVILNTGTFASGGISLITVIDNEIENVWAASYDGSNIIYFMGDLTTVVKWNTTTNTRAAVYPLIGGASIQTTFRANTTYFNGQLYLTPIYMPVYVGMIIDVSTLGGVVTIRQFQQPVPSVTGFFTFTPLGNCMGILTTAQVSPSPQRVALYKLDGTYLANIPIVDNEEFFNVVPIPNTSVYTPNNFVP